MEREYCEIIEDFNKLNDIINKYKENNQKISEQEIEEFQK